MSCQYGGWSDIDCIVISSLPIDYLEDADWLPDIDLPWFDLIERATILFDAEPALEQQL